MKNLLHHFVLAIAVIIIVTSCSQSKELSSASADSNSRMYYKEYIGNKIVYHQREVENAQVENEMRLSFDDAGDGFSEDNSLTEVDKSAVFNSMLPAPSEEIETGKTISPSQDEAITTVEDDALGNEKKIRKPVVDFLNTFKENHQNVVSGKVFTKKFHAERNAKATVPFGAREVFGLLALIFGAAAFTFGVPGLVFGILGIVFGIIGQGAADFWGIFALVGLILGIVGASLSFIFILT